MGIKQITQEESLKIIETRRPIGIFYEVDRDGDVFVGIDNSTGEAWVEEFETREECWDWLRGEKEEYLTELQKKQLKIFEHYKYEKQFDMLVEECSELIQAIMKAKRKNHVIICDDVLQELADVKNLIQQKVDRQLERIEKGE